MSRAHQPTDLEWLTSLPVDWDATEVGRDVWVRARLGWKGLTADEYVDDGVPMLATPDIKDPEIRYASANKITHGRYEESPEIMLQDGDVLLTKDGSTIGTVNVVRNLPGPATVNGSIAVMTPTGEIDGRYLFWFIASSYAQSIFGRLRGGMGVPHLFQSDINRIPMPRPPLREQHAIADYLDSETARIDTLIEEQQRLIEMLRERRESVITRAVTCGLESGNPTIDAGVATLDHVPQHWQILRIKNVGRALIGLTYAPEDVVDEGDGGSLVLRAGNIQDGRLTLDDNVYVSVEIPADLRLRVGDIVICARNGSPKLIGKNAIATDAVVGQTWGAFMVVLRSPINSYLSWVLNSQIFRSQIGLFSTATISQLTSATLHNLRFALPPKDERKRIATYLDEQTERIDALIAESKQFVELARERRASLITATVTGQIDVREVT